MTISTSQLVAGGGAFPMAALVRDRITSDDDRASVPDDQSTSMVRAATTLGGSTLFGACLGLAAGSIAPWLGPAVGAKLGAALGFVGTTIFAVASAAYAVHRE